MACVVSYIDRSGAIVWPCTALRAGYGSLISDYLPPEKTAVLILLFRAALAKLIQYRMRS
jgi:hypothetical protein